MLSYCGNNEKRAIKAVFVPVSSPFWHCVFGGESGVLCRLFAPLPAIEIAEVSVCVQGWVGPTFCPHKVAMFTDQRLSDLLLAKTDGFQQLRSERSCFHGHTRCLYFGDYDWLFCGLSCGIFWRFVFTLCNAFPGLFEMTGSTTSQIIFFFIPNRNVIYNYSS